MADNKSEPINSEQSLLYLFVASHIAISQHRLQMKNMISEHTTTTTTVTTTTDTILDFL